MMGRRPQCYIPSFVEIGPPVQEKKFREGFLPYMDMAAMTIPSFVEIGPPVQEKKFFKGFYHIWVWSCDQHHIKTFSFPCT